MKRLLIPCLLISGLFLATAVVSLAVAGAGALPAELTEGDITSFFGASDQVMTPYDVQLDGRVIISSIARDGGGPEIIWQRTYGLSSATSRFGDIGDPAILPVGFEVRDNENVITAEVFYDFEPIMMTGVLDPTQLYSRAVFRPRFGTLTTVKP